MKKAFIILVLILAILISFNNNSYSQNNSDSTKIAFLKNVSSFLNNFTIAGYLELYYAYDFFTNNIKFGNKRLLSATCPFNNEFRLDLIRLSLMYNDGRFRGKLILQYGDVPFLLKAPEKEYLGMISQGYFGVKVLDKLWVDFGYMGNPIGLESTQTSKNLLTSVTVGGYCQPDNILGVKATWYPSDVLTASIQLYNTYGIITTKFINKYLGLSLDYHPADNFDLCYNNAFTNFGLEGESNYFQMYNNFYFTWTVFEKLDINGQLDYAFQTNSKISDTTATAFLSSGLLGFRYHILPKVSIAARGEFYYDPDGIISQGIVGGNDHLNTWGLAVGIQYNPFKNFFLRGEIQFLKADQGIFYNCKDYRNTVMFSTGLEL